MLGSFGFQKTTGYIGYFRQDELYWLEFILKSQEAFLKVPVDVQSVLLENWNSLRIQTVPLASNYFINEIFP
jgi:hypothetical protein